LLDFSFPIRPSDRFDHDDRLVTSTIDHFGVALEVHGEVDLASAPRLARRIREALCLPVDRVTLDLSQVELFDSQGLHLLEDAQVAARERRVELVLVSPSRCVRRLLDLASATDRFVIRTR
jgi:anti-anti-sigma factor